MSSQFSVQCRPKIFEDFEGQEALIKEIRNRSVDMTFPQAMLFSGETGVGKSTLAFIIAKLINCEKPVKKGKYFEPCNECVSCKAVNNEEFNRDIELLDAAKLAKADLVGLEETVSYAPLYSNSRIIIINEIQELTTKQHKTLLELIERVRSNVHFIFTTMEVSKIASALVDRCQHYQLTKLEFESIATGLYSILEQKGLLEKVPEDFITDGLLLIAENSHGSLRSAIQNLERAYYGEYWKPVEIEKAFKFISRSRLNDSILWLLNKNPKFFGALETMDVERFFYMTKASLTEAAIYKFTNTLKYAWKKDLYTSMIKAGRLFEILDIYTKVEEKSFHKLNKSFFFTKILLYFNSTAVEAAKPVNAIPRMRQRIRS